MRLAEHLGVGRVRDLAVDRHDVAAHRAEGRDRVAVGLARRNLLAEVPGRQLAALDLELVRLAVALGRADVDGELAVAAELLDRGVGVLDRLAVLAGEVLDRLDALALLGLGDDDRRLALGLARLGVGGVDRVVVVAVDRDRVPAERLGAADVGLEVPADHRLAGLAEPVDVDDRRQVVELLVRGVLERLPHRALGHLGVAAQAPGPERQAVEPLAGQRDADRDRQALAERAGGHVHPRDDRHRVALELRAEAAEAQEILVGDRPRRLQQRVVERRRVALGEDQVVVARVLGVLEVEVQVLVEQDGHEVGRRHRGGGVARVGLRGGADRVDAELLAELAHAATSSSRLDSTSEKSSLKDLANFSTPSRSSVSLTSS